MVLNLGTNLPYVAARAKARRSNLADRSRLRQLLQQSNDQLAVAVADIGYRTEIDLYAGRLTGADLLETALTHNLETEMHDVLSLCAPKVQRVVHHYTDRFTYHNAKVVLRAVANEVEDEKVRFSILPEENPLHVPWLRIYESAESLRHAVELMKRLPFGKALNDLEEDTRLPTYEDALDRHYFSSALSDLKGNSNVIRMLRSYLRMEIDHRNLINLLEGWAMNINEDRMLSSMIPGGEALPTRLHGEIIRGGSSRLLDRLGDVHRFDAEGFKQAHDEATSARTLDPIVTFLGAREHAAMARMAYLQPVSALPIIHYISAKVDEVQNLRLIVRGRLAGLSTEVIEAHLF